MTERYTSTTIVEPLANHLDRTDEEMMQALVMAGALVARAGGCATA